MKTSVNGVIIIDKPAGPTSFAVVRSVRRLLQTQKVGHLGTLDPFATGVLPILLGEATKLVPFLLEQPKTYRAVLELGVETDTQDCTGKVTAVCPELPDPAAIPAVLESFRGEQLQTPPMYSALRHQGRRLYQLARQGLTVAVAPRRIVISRLELEESQPPRLTFTVSCSRGTYIRTLAVDIGRRLGCGAHLAALARLAVGPFTLDRAVPLPPEADDTARQQLLDHLLSLAEALPPWPTVTVDATAARALRQGRTLPWGAALASTSPPPNLGEQVCVLNQQELVAVCEVGGVPGSLALLPRRVFAAHPAPPSSPCPRMGGVSTVWPHPEKNN